MTNLSALRDIAGEAFARGANIRGGQIFANRIRPLTQPLPMITWREAEEGRRNIWLPAKTAKMTEKDKSENAFVPVFQLRGSRR
jgi:hypothetical protein